MSCNVAGGMPLVFTQKDFFVTPEIQKQNMLQWSYYIQVVDIDEVKYVGIYPEIVDTTFDELCN